MQVKPQSLGTDTSHWSCPHLTY